MFRQKQLDKAGDCNGRNLSDHRRNRVFGKYSSKGTGRAGKKVVGLRLPGDKAHLLPEVEYQLGDITKPYTLDKFFAQAEGKQAVVIHCAGLVTIASKNNRVWNVNVDGTRNIVDLCERHKIANFIYVSSVHAIRECDAGQTIKEEKQFSASLVKGIYGKSKAEATAYVLKATERIQRYGCPSVRNHRGRRFEYVTVKRMFDILGKITGRADRMGQSL